MPTFTRTYRYNVRLNVPLRILPKLSVALIDILNPLRAWIDIEEYHRAAKELIQKFIDNYKIYDLGDKNILEAGPKYQ